MISAISVKEQLRISHFYTFFEKHYAGGYSFPGETHDFWECVYVLSGSVVASADDRIYELSEGSLIFHKPMELHKLNVPAEQSAHLLIFTYSMNGPLAEFFRDKVFRLSVSQKEELNDLLLLLRKSAKEFPLSKDELFTFMFLTAANKQPAYLQKLAFHLSLFFLSFADESREYSASSTLDAQQFQRVVAYMNRQITTSVSVSEIAKECHLSESGLKRLFTRYAGMGVHRYMLRLKLNNATKLLQAGMSVSEVAEYLGFSSQSYFSSVFRRETGSSPSICKASQKTLQIQYDNV